MYQINPLETMINKSEKITVNLGLTPKSIQNVLKKENWVNIYRKELKKRSSGLIESDFPKGNFTNLIKPELERSFKKELSIKKTIDVRESIRRWMQISTYKSLSLIKLLHQIPKELSESTKISNKYSDIMIGPQDPEIMEQMTPAEVKRWAEGNVALLHTTMSMNNLLGFFVSELFFAVESMCRVICIGSCLEFAIKSITPEMIIQHDEIFRTLKRLGHRETDKVTCRLCAINEKCTGLYAYSNIASIYELFYHIRCLKDYRLEFYFKKELTQFLLFDYMYKGFELACTIDNIMHRLFIDYLVSPCSLADQKEMISNILYQVKSANQTIYPSRE